jgi:glycosyltransferase involved in cell wall biosynthesis
VVVVHRALLGPLEVALLRRSARRWLFDFDDAIMVRDSAAAPRFASWQRRVRFLRMTRHADHVIAGNDYLADQARDAAAGVTVIPTVVDLDHYGDGTGTSEAPVVGWMGTRINLMYLAPLAAPLARLAARHPEMRVKVVSDGSVTLPGVPLVAKPWRPEEELADLRSFRVGIMPLPDDPWTHGKCGVKLLQYMAAGVPVVCSPVGANSEIVQDGITGYLARGDDEWVSRIEQLLTNPARCREIAAAGRRTIEERYSVAAQLDRLLATLSPT